MIIQSHTSGGRRRTRTFNHSPIDAPVLTIRTEGTSATASITVRTKLKAIVDNLDHQGFTPIVDTMYEAAKYYRGEDVVWGKQRGFDNGSGAVACLSPPTYVTVVAITPMCGATPESVTRPLGRVGRW